VYSVGRALAVPRYPTALAHGASTPLQALDHVGHLGLSDALSWPGLLELEAVRIFATAMSNDLCPRYFHQRNLASGNAGALDVPDRYDCGLSLHSEQVRVDPRATR
jgi:hypothetical protein